MARKTLIPAAIVTGMVVSAAEAGHGDVSGKAAGSRGQIHQEGNQADDDCPDEMISGAADPDGMSDVIPSFFGGGAVTDLPQDVFGAPADFDADLLHHFDGRDAALIAHDDIVIEADEGATNDDWFQLAQTVYGGTGNDGIMSPGVRNNTRIPGGNRTDIGSGVKAPSVGTPVKPRTVPGKSLQTRQDIRRKDMKKNKRK